MKEQTLKDIWMSLEDKQTPLCNALGNTRYGDLEIVKFYFITSVSDDNYLYGLNKIGQATSFPMDSVGWQIYKEPKKKIKVYCPDLVMNIKGELYFINTKLFFKTKDKSNWFANPNNVKVLRWHEEEIYENFEDNEEAE